MFKRTSQTHIFLRRQAGARFFGLYAGIPGLVYGPTSQDIHAFDERVELESIRLTAQAIALFIADWCGVRAG